jgi:tetratricopeptide (TPR) repeat protein
VRTREDLYSALMNRVIRASTEQRSDLLFSAEADRDAVELAGHVDLDTDIDATFMLGMFHWLRYQASPSGPPGDYAMSARFFTPIYRVWPDRVPTQLHPLCAASTTVWTDDSLNSVANKALDASRAYERTGHPMLAQYAVQMFRIVVDARGPEYTEYPKLLGDLAIALVQLSEHTDDIETIREAIAVGYAGIDAAGASATHPGLPLLRSTLGTALAQLARRTGDRDGLDQAVAMCRAAVDGTGEHDPNRPAYQAGLAQTLIELFDRDHRIEDLEEAVETARSAAAVMALDHPNAQKVRHFLAKGLDRLAAITGNAGLLAEAAESARTVLAVTPTDHSDYLVTLQAYASLAEKLFERTGERQMLDQAIGLLRAAVPRTAEGTRDRTDAQAALGGRLAALALYLDDHALLSEAVSLGRSAVEGTDEDGEHWTEYAIDLASSLDTQFELTGSPGALVEAIDLMRAVVARTPTGHPRYASRAAVLSRMLHIRFLNGGGIAALTEAVELGRAAVDSSVDHPGRGHYQAILASALATQFEHTGELELLVEAVEIGRASVTAANDVQWSGFAWSSLSNALRRLFERTGEVALAFEALKINRAVVAQTRADSPYRADQWSHMALALQAVYECTGEIDLLKEGVEFGRAAVAAASASRPGQPVVIAAHVNVLTQIARVTGDSEYLVEAVRVGRSAVTATGAGQPNRAVIMNAASAAHLELFQRTRIVRYLNDAIRLCYNAVDEAPETHANHAQYLATLAIMLSTLSDVSGDQAPLTEAIRLSRAVVESVATESERPGFMLDLANFLRSRARSTGELGPLEESLELSRSALEAVPRSHPDWPLRQFNLALALTDAARRTGVAAHRQEARDRFRLSAETTNAAPLLRVQAYLRIAALADPGEGPAVAAVAAIEDAVRLLPHLTPAALGRSDREFQLVRAGALPELAAASALAAGQGDRAAELLERTRGLLVADALVARSGDMALLEDLAPHLAASFREVRRRLDHLDRQRTTVEAVPRTDAAQPEPSGRAQAVEAGWLTRARGQAEAEWARVIDAIHDVDGLAGFLAAPDIRDLTKQARDGRVVFVIAAETGCHALVLTGDTQNPTRVVPLDGLTESDAYDRTDRLQAARRTVVREDLAPDQRIAAQAEILDVLEWLWDAVTGPIMAALGYTGMPADEADWPRLWWCPVGILSYLPLHAAGHHADSDGIDPGSRAHPRTVLDRVVSSYITTVRALAYARVHEAGATETMLVVAAPEVPELRPLDGVEAEVEQVTELVPTAACLPDPSRRAVLDALPEHQIAHFACHAVVDLVDLARSRLVLPDHRTDPLTLVDISALRLTGGLAYLSACDTNVTANPRFADEAVHITGAFHLAGYQHVVGTLWPIADSTARRIAADFYAYLTADGAAPPDISRSAHALHFATRRLRERFRASPTLWAAHTHTGI